MKRYMAFPLFCIPPDTGAGSGGTTENNAGTSGATTSGAVESGTASDAMLAAFAASSAAEGDSDPDLAVAEEEPNLTGDTSAAGGAAAATGNATGSQVPTGTRGEAPEPRIVAATRNARETAIRETEEKYAWTRGASREDVEVAFGLTTALMNDTPGFAAKLASEIGMKLVPITDTKTPATTTGAAPTPFKLPKAELRSEDGKGAFSEDQMLQMLTDFEAHLEAKFGERVKPLETMRVDMTRREQESAIRTEAESTVKEMMADFRARPHFMVDDGKGGKIEHPSILKNLQAIPKQVRIKIGAEAAMSRAYSKYLAEEVFPHIGTTAAAQVRDENARKLRGSTGNASVSGSTGRGAGVSLKDGDLNGLAAHMAKLAGSNASV